MQSQPPSKDTVADLYVWNNRSRLKLSHNQGLHRRSLLQQQQTWDQLHL